MIVAQFILNPHNKLNCFKGFTIFLKKGSVKLNWTPLNGETELSKKEKTEYSKKNPSI